MVDWRNFLEADELFRLEQIDEKISFWRAKRRRLHNRAKQRRYRFEQEL